MDALLVMGWRSLTSRLVAQQLRCPIQLKHFRNIVCGSERVVDLKTHIMVLGHDIIQCWGPAKTKSGAIPDASSR